MAKDRDMTAEDIAIIMEHLRTYPRTRRMAAIARRYLANLNT